MNPVTPVTPVNPANSASPPSPIRGVLETCLYAPDLAAAEAFYTSILGLTKVADNAPRAMTFRIERNSVLLLFNPRETRQKHEIVPSHGAEGPGHVALRIDESALDAWRAHLPSRGVPIEREVQWPNSGARSIYVRDPAHNSIELITVDIWPESPA